VVQLVFRVQKFAKGNCVMLRGCADEILAKNNNGGQDQGIAWHRLVHDESQNAACKNTQEQSRRNEGGRDSGAG
jgi:hypothetical protein